MTLAHERFALAGKVAIITGAGGRGNSIGRAYALGLAGAGASIAVADLDEPGARRVAEEVTAAGGQAVALRVDITDRSSVDAMVEATEHAFGGVDILVNNAAMMAEIEHAPPSTISLDAWERIMMVNLTGALHCSQAVVPKMRARGGGKIVNQISAGAYPPRSVYGISKIALAGLTTAMAFELGPDRINVNGIAPGNTMSDAGKQLTPDGSAFVNRLEGQIAMRLRGQPDELIGTLLLLCSEAGDWITGQVLHVDGGWVIRP